MRWRKQKYKNKMKQEKIIMGMTVRIEIADPEVDPEIFAEIFGYFEAVDKRFSTFKTDSEISKINRAEIEKKDWSPEMQEVFKLAEKTKKEADGYFDIRKQDGQYDPSGIVKGWAIWQAAGILKKEGYRNFYIDIGGDIEACGKNQENQPWTIGIRNPLKPAEIIKKIAVENKGVATSGTYVHKNHIYNPQKPNEKIKDIISLTVIGPNIYEADRFATATFAMGLEGIYFLEKLAGFEGYLIDPKGLATFTSGFEGYVI
jgi:thiamine biosynthesis lipoprotein